MASLRAHLAHGAVNLPTTTPRPDLTPTKGAAGIWSELGSVLSQAVIGAEQSLRTCQARGSSQSPQGKGTPAGAGEGAQGRPSLALEADTLQRCAALGSAAASALELAGLDLFLRGPGIPPESSSPLPEARQSGVTAEQPSSVGPGTPGPGDLLSTVEDLLREGGRGRAEDASQRSTGGASTSGSSHGEGRSEGGPLLRLLAGAEARHALHASRTRALVRGSPWRVEALKFQVLMGKGELFNGFFS